MPLKFFRVHFNIDIMTFPTMAPTFTIHAQEKSLLNSHGIKEFLFQSNDIYAIIFYEQ